MADIHAKDRTNALPPEMLQHILGSALQGSLDEQFATLNDIKNTNRNFRSQLMSQGPLKTRHQQLLGLVAIRTRHPMKASEAPVSYARRLPNS